ncbi:HAD-like domain-containing protein [Cynara cardunculus var. scolymus]|uniref:5'-nucleotidase n=1 Tax=Cynara cardunculus var. scolymus TaxID=59895 RepID=A0A118K2X8_CYNCS|nr:HAD-like domain-containing protein [Cynara cardunculus var. scolymus]
MSLSCFRLHGFPTFRCISHRLITLSHFHFRVRGFSRTSMNQAEIGAMVNGSKCCSSKVVINDPKLLHHKKTSIRLAGPSKFQVIADFDNTLTKFWVDGCRGQSSHGLLQQENPEYNAKRDELFNYYHPIEYDPQIPIDEKTKLMEEWWGKSHGLLIEGGLTYDAIRSSVAGAVIAFREGVVELFEFLEARERYPGSYIFSRSSRYHRGGKLKPGPVHVHVLRQKLHRTFKNVKIVSNRMKFDQNGNLVSFTGKLIHSLNKNEHALDMAASLHDHLGEVDDQIIDSASVKKRTNVLLLGDHMGDLRMSDGLNYETRISVGFLNHNIENSLDSYREGFDIVYLDDAPMSGVVKLVSELFSPATD